MGAAVAVTGRGHLEDGLPCQDDCAASLSGGAAAIVLSDGAGSARHSEHGAAVAVRATIGILHDTSPWADLAEVQARILKGCRVEIATRAMELSCPVSELAATLAFVAVDGDAWIAGNLGDGVVGALQGDRAEVLITPTRGEFANETTFLTSRHAHERFRIAKAPFNEYDGFAIMSDGAAESLYGRRDGTLAPALIKVLSWSENQASVAVANAIRGSLMPLLVERTRDDCSLAVLRRVHVDLDALDQKCAAFRTELLGVRNTLGLRNREAVLRGYRHGLSVDAISEATGLKRRTIRGHQRAIQDLLPVEFEHRNED